MTETDLSAVALAGIVSVCQHDGISAERVLDAGGVDIAAVNSPKARVLRSQGVAVMRAMSEASPGTGAAFRAGLAFPVEHTPELARIFTSAPSLKSLVGPLNAAIGGFCGGTVGLSVNSAYARLGFGFPNWNAPIEEPWQEAAAGAVICLLRLRFGPGWNAAHVLIGHRRDKPKVVEFEGYPIVRGAPDNAIILVAADALVMPMPGKSKSKAIRESDDESLYNSDPSLHDRVRQVIYGRSSLAIGVTVDDVSRVFGISARSLKRKLSLEGHSFSSIAKSVKLTEAKRLLAETSLPVTEIADILQYGHLASFSKAFARSEGISPSDYRKMLDTARAA